MKFARIEENRVTETFETANHETLKVAFHPDIAALFTACPDDVQPGWLFENGVYLEPDVTPLLPSKQNLLDYAADKKWRVETGGILFNGFPIATDDRSKIMLLGAREKAKDNPSFQDEWHIGANRTVTLDAATIIALSNRVLDHVSQCFAFERKLSAKINEGVITTFEQIEHADWPSNT